MARLTASASKWVHKNVLLDFGYRFQDTHQHDTEDFFENSMRNEANSYDDRYTSDRHTIDVGSTINLNTVQLLPKLSWEAVREHEDYTRGNLDTTTTRHAMFLRPELKAKWKITKMSTLELNYALRTSQPKLIETLRYRDDSDPLYVREGNPNLRNMHTNALSLSYNATNSKRQRMLNIGLNFQNSDRAVQFVQTYNPLTSVYVTQPEMVRGSRQASVSMGLDQGLGNEFRLKNNLTIPYGQMFGYLTRTSETEALQLNRRRSFSPTENLTLSYDHQWLKCSLFTIVTMNRLRFSQSPQQNTTLWNERIGASVTLEWRNLTFASSLTEYIRNGYLISSMNDNYLLWDASVTWKFLNNKARLRLTANDILNQLDTFYAQQGAYQNIYSWRDQMHHFVNISFTYHFDAKKK